ncbi:MAG: type I restriction enzyme HsdR N-terminal domain-containing protein [Flavobacteriaceae bacterium]|nr:type I restriction enzyme HsdR N-terminal domain-containing protein [Flavobacteriaceae bacterium]
MQKLNFPAYSFRFKNSEKQALIFDVIRKKFVVLTPEEWVRQHVVHYLVTDKGFSSALINVEKQLLLNGTKKRYDAVVFDKYGNVRLLVECKAPHIQITQEVFDQIARYNLVTKAPFLMVTNGLDHYYCRMDYDNEQYIFLEDVPNLQKE